MVYFLAVVSIGMFETNPVVELLSLFGGILFCLSLGKAQNIKKDVCFYALLVLIVTATNPLFSHNGVTPIFFLNQNPVTLEALVYGAYIAVMIVSVMLWFKAYSTVMTSDKFICLFGRVMPKLTLVLSMALRYVPLLKIRAKKIFRAQKTMGAYSGESRYERIRTSGETVSALVGRSLESAVETGNAMKAKGYGIKGRTHYSDFKFQKSDFVMLLLCLSLFAITAAGMAGGKIDFNYYPEISKIPLDFFSVICYAAYGLLSFLPFIIETEEMIRWKYYRSKI